ncbi:MAG: bifunctional helix-turn-helix domain-containing protein/methylated-DNA--[protein]-cysteine S-methyltransferase [Hyphomicrobiales bacterium]|nr:bifunctional helix-turn-helix domain-containing protein/methylated-DNA--[protein]-cysteine S-methyltransferase [Hyphomicrobiales bacterium]
MSTIASAHGARGSAVPALAGDFDPEDYRRVCGAIAYLTENRLEQPALAAVAADVGLSEAHFQRLFKRWAGLSPKEFLQALTLDHARALLRDSASVLDTALEVGLSGPGRLHDLFVAHEAMSPGEYKAGGAGLKIVYGFHPSPFGEALVMASPRGLAGLAFADSPDDRAGVLADMMRRWPKANYVEDPARTSKLAGRIFDATLWNAGEPLRVVLIGTDFEVRVWRTLLRIPLGRVTTYGDIAAHLGRPKAARAVGAAVGRNPVSFVVPCHRVLGKSGALTGYHWGLTRKRAIIGWEAGLAKGA